ncbi:MAG: hypothetical protein ACRC80_00025, partial [Waterburya sp.]
MNNRFLQIKPCSVTFLRRSLCLLGIALFWVFGGTLSLHAAELKAVPPAIHNSEPPQGITTPDQALMYLNAQNLVNTWN